MRRRSQEAGYAAVLVCLLSAAVFIPVAALAVDVARWYVEVQRVQNAADAAATAGVTYLPSDLASARSTAIAVAARNGFPVGDDVSIDVRVGDKPTRLKVTISSTIPNSLAGYFDHDYATITRSAVADYNGPAPMGSPCNSFGNEPLGALVPDANRGPRSSVIVVPPGGATCTSTPQFWGAIAGPDTPKGNGDAYMTRSCSSGNSGCTGTTNTDFDPLGYFYMIRVGTAAIGSNVTLQVYDPAFVQNGDTCGDGPKTTTALRNNMSPYVPNDGTARYAPGASTPFCNGDMLNGGSASDIITSYVLRSPTDTYQPKLAPAIPSCQRQYPGYDANATKSEALDSTQGSKYKADVAKVYRQWVDLCTFTPSVAGDYYLQVRTNVKLGGVSDGQGGYTGNSKVWEQLGDDTSVKGIGNNRWSLRVRGPQRAAVSISGYDHMGVYANYSGSVQTFNLVRVVPAAATKTLNIGFYDTGDASNPGTITIKGPTDSNLPATLTGCTGGGAVTTGALPGCKLSNVHSGTYNGKWQFVNVPIPDSYTCNVSATGGCWFRVTFDWAGSAPTDTTTWTARIDGDPIRLIE